MAYMTHTLINSPVFGRIAAVVADLAERRANYSVYRTTIKELSELTSRDLADLGISRANIKSVAYEAAYK